MSFIEAEVAAQLAALRPDGVAPASVCRVRSAAGEPGAVRVDLTGWTGSVAELAQEAGAAAWSERVAHKAPNMYVNLAPRALYDAVVGGILRHGRGVGESTRLAGHSVILAFSCPNTNKPLHVGHLRNNAIGMALVRLFESQGAVVHRQSPHNDFGIHHAQAVLAWLKCGDGETPESAGVKGDHLVGRYYAMFHAREAAQRGATAGPEDSESSVPEGGTTELMREALDLLGRMERGDESALAANWMLADWADAGIKETYRRMGTAFESIYYDRHHLELGRELIEQGIREGSFQVRPDGSVYVDLTDHALGQVTLRRADGTPLSWRHWLAYDINRYTTTPFDTGIHVLGRQWESGFFVFRHLMRMLGHPWFDDVEGLFYGMVSLPEGRMRSRDGRATSADALFDRVRDRLMDDLLEDPDLPPWFVCDELCDALGVALVKYAMLRRKAEQDLVFDEEQLWREVLPDFARTLRLLGSTRRARNAADPHWGERHDALGGNVRKRLLRLLVALDDFPRLVATALDERDPFVVVRGIDEITREAAACRRLLPEDDAVWRAVAIVLGRAFELLNIALPSLELLPPVMRLARRDAEPETSVGRDVAVH